MKKQKLGSRIAEQIFVIVMLLSFTRIDYFYDALHQSTLFEMISIAALGVAFMMILGTILLKRIWSVDLLWILIFFGFILIMTIIFRPNNVIWFLRSYSGAIGYCLLAWYYFRNNKISFFLNAFIALEVLIYLNLLCVIIYPKGMYATKLYWNNWLLGYKNPQIRLTLPVFGISLIRGFEKKNRITMSSLILYVCIVLTAFAVNSSTGISSAILTGLLVFLFFYVFKEKGKWFSLSKCSLVILGINIGLIFFDIQTKFVDYISLFGKNETLSGRTKIWQISLSEIMKKPIGGYGFLIGTDYLDIYFFDAAYHPHNYLLYLLMQGGILLLVILGFGIFYSSKKIREHESLSSRVVVLILVVLLFIGLDESITGNNFIYMFIIIGMQAEKFKSGKVLTHRIKFLLK